MKRVKNINYFNTATAHQIKKPHNSAGKTSGTIVRLFYAALCCPMCLLLPYAISPM